MTVTAPSQAADADSAENQGSPMVVAYNAASASAPGHLVLFRVGEFYEVLYGAAQAVSQALGIQLTRRRQKNGVDIPMCGIPASRSQALIARLLAAGHKLALCEQPAESGGTRPLRFLTLATSVDADVVPADRPNNLLVVHAEAETVGLAYIDLSTGESGTGMASLREAGSALARMAPAEILISRWPDGSDALAVAVRGSGVSFADLHQAPSTPAANIELLTQAFGSEWQSAFRGFSALELTTLGALLAYVKQSVGKLPANLALPRRSVAGDTMEIDSPTLRGLEVFTSASGRAGALVAVLDRTVTSAGGRLLARQMAAPLTRPALIERRLAMVECLVKDAQARQDCRAELEQMPDMLRACGRLSLSKAGPRDLAAVRDGLERASTLAAHVGNLNAAPPGLASVARDLALAGVGSCGELLQVMRRAISDRPPVTLAELGFVADGYAARVDTARTTMQKAKNAIEALQVRFIAETGVKSLRVRTNSIIGYHVELPAGHRGKPPGDDFILRQGLASSTRYSSTDLDSAATLLEESSDMAAKAEEAVFTALANMAMTERDALTRIAHASAALDLIAGLAQAAAEGGWVRPEIDAGRGLDLEGGRHPVAERLLEEQGRAFVENDCRMGDDERLWLLTGPNMAGKSTFLRQVAVIVLMAQLGSFVPARAAKIGIVDKMFSRIGASDDLAAGRSTFLVEMLETAAILNGATDRTLVILDEVGRGTSTHDGLAIAQACMENLHDEIGCRTLFATHFHELADAAGSMPNAACMAMDATAGHHGEIFAYKVKRGRALQSYGLKAVALAGLPRTVLDRAAALLVTYENGARSGDS